MAKGKNGGKNHDGARWVQLSQLYDIGAYDMTDEDRAKVLDAVARPLSCARLGELGEAEPISFVEEVIACLFLFIFIGSMFWLPLALVLFAVFVRSAAAWIALFVAWAILSTHPIPRVQALVHSRLNRLLFKYFSLKMACDEGVEKGHYIFIAPPHGVLPYGNLLTVHAMRNLIGMDFRGLTTDAALKLPLFRHYLAAIGTVPASSHVAKKWLDKGWSIGISSGGVAEIFECNNADEVILMRERKGFVKLALRTGVPIVPCYIFGNTKLMSAWYDQGGYMQAISRRLQFGLLPIWGRFGLPLMHRHAILGVVGKPIVVPKVEGEPSKELIDKYHAEFVNALQALFEKYKGYYGWEHRKLIIK